MEAKSHSNGVDRKLVRGKGGLRMVNVNQESKSPFETEEPPWAQDSKFRFCHKCMKKFTLTVRRHHCRRCGSVFCSECCHDKISLQRLCFVDPERACKDCIPLIKVENTFFNKHLKVLLEGAAFLIHDKSFLHCYLNPISQHQALLARVGIFATPDEALHVLGNIGELLFKQLNGNEDANENPIQLTSIASIEYIPETIEGVEKFVGVVLKIKEGHDLTAFRMVIQHGSPNEDSSHAFLLAMQQAVKLIFDAD